MQVVGGAVEDIGQNEKLRNSGTKNEENSEELKSFVLAAIKTRFKTGFMAEIASGKNHGLCFKKSLILLIISIGRDRRKYLKIKEKRNYSS